MLKILFNNICQGGGLVEKDYDQSILYGSMKAA
jgi:hypothetical protein